VGWNDLENYVGALELNAVVSIGVVDRKFARERVAERVSGVKANLDPLVLVAGVRLLIARSTP